MERASQHLRATTDPDERVSGLSSVALGLFKLGKVEEARKIVDMVAPAAKQLPPKTRAAACATAGEAVSLFDLPAGVRLIYAARDAGDNNYWTRALFHVAYRIAKEQRAEAERLAAEAIAFSRRSYSGSFRRANKREPTEEELAMSLCWDEQRLVPLCYALVAVDADRAEHVAATIQTPGVRAYAVGMIAKALAPTDKSRARKLILQAYDRLAETGRSADRRWSRDSWRLSPPVVAAGLLPVVEAIDPTLVGECVWRAVSYRLPRSADDCLVSLEPETNDASLAAPHLALRSWAGPALLPSMDKTIVPAPLWTPYFRVLVFAMIDANEALKQLQASAASPGTDADRCFGDAFYLMEMLPIPGTQRWDSYAMNHCWLWNPDNQYQEAGSYSW